MKRQKDLIRRLDDAPGQSWLLLLDAGRADYFQDLFLDELPDSATYQTVHNGRHSFTPYWFEEMFSYHVDGHLFHGGQSISGTGSGTYRSGMYWETIPSKALYESWSPPDANISTPDPASVNEVVRSHLITDAEIYNRLQSLGYTPDVEAPPSFNMNVVRYLQPHTPYRNERAIRNHRYGIRRALEEGERSPDDIDRLYRDNYEWGFEHAKELAIELSENENVTNVVISADHGECLGDCGRFWHSGGDHDHLFEVPWVEFPT